MEFRGARARLVLALDVTARLRAEEDVERFVSLVENSGDFIAMASLDWRIVYLNKAGRELVGLTAESLVLDTPGVRGCGTPETRATVEREVLPRIAAGQSWTFDGRLRHARTGEPVEVECSAFGIRDAQSGRVLAGAFVLRDLTERMRVQEHLRQAQRMEAIGRVAGGVAHEVNNMMTVILGFCTFLARGMEENDTRQEDVGQIAHAADRAADVSRQLLAYSRRQLLQPLVLELNAVLVDMESVLRRLMGEDREFILRLAPQLGWVRTDRAQFEQVIINLALNARDAMPQGGRLAIETSDGGTERRRRASPSRHGGAAWALRARGGERHRPRHGRPHPGPDLRAVLHHQAGGARHRPRPVHRLRHREAERWTHLGVQRGGRGQRRSACTCRRSRRAASGSPGPYRSLPPRGQGERVLVVEDESAGPRLRLPLPSGGRLRDAGSGERRPALDLIGADPGSLDLVLCGRRDAADGRP